MVDAFFKIAIIDACYAIADYQSRYGGAIASAVQHLKTGVATRSAFDYSNGEILGANAGWDAFLMNKPREQQLRYTLETLIIRLKPWWAHAAYLGRDKVLETASPDQLQCLFYAGLLGQMESPDICGWWERIAAFYRAEEDNRRLLLGREGERLTIEHEKERLHALGILKTPVWKALSDNTAGYDVLSFDPDLGDLYIEVKACAFSPLQFHLTRNEWNTAERFPFSYVFDIWDVDAKRLRRMDVAAMRQHIPKDLGHGEWREAVIVL